MPFFQLNWVIVAMTLIFLVGFIVLEASFHFVSEVIGIAAYKLYLLILLMGSIAAFLNYIAIKVFGSWELLVMFIVITVLVLVVLGFIIRRKVKQHKERKELRTLRNENEQLRDTKAINDFDDDHSAGTID